MAGKAINGQRQHADVHQRDGQAAERGGDSLAAQAVLGLCDQQHSQQVAHAAAQAKAQALEGVRLTIPAKTSATGTVFGSVNAMQVAAALQALGHDIDRKIVDVKVPVKEVGVYTAVVRFHKNVAVEVEFEVIPEEEPQA